MAYAPKSEFSQKSVIRDVSLFSWTIATQNKRHYKAVIFRMIALKFPLAIGEKY